MVLLGYTQAIAVKIVYIQGTGVVVLRPIEIGDESEVISMAGI